MRQALEGAADAALEVEEEDPQAAPDPRSPVRSGVAGLRRVAELLESLVVALLDLHRLPGGAALRMLREEPHLVHQPALDECLEVQPMDELPVEQGRIIEADSVGIPREEGRVEVSAAGRLRGVDDAGNFIAQEGRRRRTSEYPCQREPSAIASTSCRAFRRAASSGQPRTKLRIRTFGRICTRRSWFSTSHPSELDWLSRLGQESARITMLKHLECRRNSR